jgi:hypothetical protein
VKILELAIVIAGAAAVVLWRGAAMYNQTFKKKDL